MSPMRPRGGRISSNRRSPTIDAANARRRTELLETLDVLESLRADSETLAACIVHALPSTDIDVGKIPHMRDLLDGQQAAEKVWSLYASRGVHGSAEGLRRLLLAIIRDLRVVFILLARQLATLRLAGKLPPERQRRSGPTYCRHPRAARQQARHLAIEMGTGRSRVPLSASGHLSPHRYAARRTPRSTRDATSAKRPIALRAALAAVGHRRRCRRTPEAHLFDLEKNAAQRRRFRVAVRHPRACACW